MRTDASCFPVNALAPKHGLTDKATASSSSKTLQSQYLSTCSGAHVLKKRLMYLSKASFSLITRFNNCTVPINQGCIPGVGRAHSAAGLPGQVEATDGAWRREVGWGSLRLNTLTDSRGRMSYARHPFRRVCTHSIYKCHPWPT